MKDQIIEAQRKVLNDLAAHELTISELYDLYAAMHPQNSSLWSALAKEEQMHSSMLTSLNKLLDDGNLFWNIGQFSNKIVAEELAAVHDAMNQARNNNPSETECLEAAIRIEASLLESKFYSVVTSDAKDFAFVCQALSRATEMHLQHLKDKLIENGTSLRSKPEWPGVAR